MAEADVGEHSAEPVREGPGGVSEEAQGDGDEDESDAHCVEEDGDAEDDAHFFGWEVSAFRRLGEFDTDVTK